MNAPMDKPMLDMAICRRKADALRVLAVDAVEQAKSGHPGAPLGMAEMATALWGRHLRHNPGDPSWVDRDRFVLSNGHASMLLYALLHLTGYELGIDDLKQFRQLHSKTPGHPEVGVTPGVETTTGPLGQGLANAVGMALAEKLLAAEFNRDGHAVVDHRTWVFLGDGCLMEGISQEAISLAGTLGLGKLIALYDDNGISIDGEVRDWFGDDTPARFRACGWHVIGPLDGHDLHALDTAITHAVEQSRAPDAKPTLVVCRTTIGKGAPGHEGTADVHGSPLGAAGVAALRAQLGWSHGPFEVPQDLRQAWDERENGAAIQQAWTARFKAYAQAHPALASEFDRRMRGELAEGFAARMDEAVVRLVGEAAKPVATRKASQNVLDALGAIETSLLGGSADLTGSNLTDFKGHRKLTPAGMSEGGNYLSYGVREFGMAAVMNGVALHGGLIPYGGTFLTFSDYSRNAIRMAALMKQRVIHVFTHDSIGLGEDGPTHQPIEQVASLRLIPGLDVWRPADTLETAVAWQCAVQRRDGPAALVLSRQALPAVAAANRRDDARRGGYVLQASRGPRPQVVLLATGSEVPLALTAQQTLSDVHGVDASVVSMPCTSVFDRQDAAWRDQVLPPGVPVVAIEAGHPNGLLPYTRGGEVLGIRSFGESAPGPTLMKHFGFEPTALVAAAHRAVQAADPGA